MPIIPGVETIVGLTGQPPVEIPISHKTMASQQRLIEDWNSLYVAIIPYCFKCKVPLAWYMPREDDQLFVCPSCGRVWVCDEEWKERNNK